MSARCVIISGGEFSPISEIYTDDYVIACDKGYEYAVSCGIMPDLVVGDFDSYSGDVARDIPVDRYVSEKDDTDTMIAVRFAIEQGFDELAVFCALGGRLDHMLANLQSAKFAAEHGADVWLHDKSSEIYVFSGGIRRIEKKEGYSLSVFALSDECSGVNIKGAKYSLEDASVTNAFPIGVSNEWREYYAEISADSGILMVVLSKM